MGVRNTDNQLYSTVPTERHIKSFYDDGENRLARSGKFPSLFQ